MINSFDGEFAFLSNFFTSPFEGPDGTVFMTVEHYFQAMKTTDKIEFHTIASALTPGIAKRLGRRCLLREDWEQIKEKVMEDGLRFKFADPELRQKLIDTHPHDLIEGNWWGDRFWGVCDGIGENKLGKLLMKLRAEYMLEK